MGCRSAMRLCPRLLCSEFFIWISLTLSHYLALAGSVLLDCRSDACPKEVMYPSRNSAYQPRERDIVLHVTRQAFAYSAMSIDINWETLTGGADGKARAEAIREFIHDRFQQVTLPRFIRSVRVHSFDFGSVPPEIEIKDICDPLPDFYEEDEDYPDGDDTESSGHESRRDHSNEPPPRTVKERSIPSASTIGLRPTLPLEQFGNFLPRASTPGIPGGTSNINYFHLPLSAGLSGSTTPLAAVAGARLQGWPDHLNARPSTPTTDMRLRNVASFGSLTLTPQTNPETLTRPSSQHQQEDPRRSPGAASSRSQSQHGSARSSSPPLRETSPEDIQVVAHVQYSGDIRLSLTAEILLDYPMPSFVGIPLKLNISGLTFDGVSILAYIKKRAHFCFLSPEDADAFVGSETNLESPQSEVKPASQHNTQRPKLGGLLEHIKVESEIGGKGDGKQVLKNVGKVESFVLEQVRRIFEDEFVYPSFWTFLV
ncbi:hypothetical protein M011DRAFT_455424 [Sporormia fimetaria CBS 119925]|uniref:Mitochondrial distribution and morphology protein 12 n=1 Tax=Sporormia fimetaria CBS 119925 TaxID=1340428 RepID=A0A6A6VLD9_9PLEO|nr:hypothetical protein M011DRAFT_455424 [Sporormia fimetaria CBS 119925]